MMKYQARNDHITRRCVHYQSRVSGFKATFAAQLEVTMTAIIFSEIKYTATNFWNTLEVIFSDIFFFFRILSAGTLDKLVLDKHT
jgi:hypothetical protein